MSKRRVRNMIGALLLVLVFTGGAAVIVWKWNGPQLVQVIVKEPGKPLVAGEEFGLMHTGYLADGPWMPGADKVEVYARHNSDEREYRLYYIWTIKANYHSWLT